jgi:hypothetical protein
MLPSVASCDKFCLLIRQSGDCTILFQNCYSLLEVSLSLRMLRSSLTNLHLVHLIRSFRDGDQVLMGLLDFLHRSLELHKDPIIWGISTAIFSVSIRSPIVNLVSNRVFLLHDLRFRLLIQDQQMTLLSSQCRQNKCMRMPMFARPSISVKLEKAVDYSQIRKTTKKSLRKEDL